MTKRIFAGFVAFSIFALVLTVVLTACVEGGSSREQRWEVDGVVLNPSVVRYVDREAGVVIYRGNSGVAVIPIGETRLD